MAIKCYNKPNRTRKRTFRTCDGVRISREIVVDDNTTPEAYLACVAMNLGFTHISLSRTRVVESGSLPSPRTLLAVAQATLRLIDSLITRFERQLTIIRALITIKKAIEDVLDLIPDDFPAQARVQDIINIDKCRCKQPQG